MVCNCACVQCACMMVQIKTKTKKQLLTGSQERAINLGEITMVSVHGTPFLMDVPRRVLGRQLGLVSSTSADPQSIWCCSPHTCSAIADAPLLTAPWCSFILHARERPDCPIYVFSQSLQGILYTTPFRWSTGKGSFGLTNIWRRVRTGLRYTWTSSFSRNANIMHMVHQILDMGLILMVIFIFILVNVQLTESENWGIILSTVE